MYKIKLINPNQSTVFIQDSINNVVTNPQLEEAVNSAGTLTFSVEYDNPHYNDFHNKQSVIEVYNESDQLEFRGILEEQTKYFDGSKELVFNGELVYLNDIQYPPYEYSGSVETLFTNLLNYYNSKCSEDRQIQVGTITVTDPNNYITRSNEAYSSIWSVLTEKLVSMLGGYLSLRYVGNTRYLDYLIDFNVQSTQKIEFGKNLIDLNDYIDSTEVATVLLPFGAQNEETKIRVDIKSVNDGKEYIETPLIDTYGRIEKVVIWDDVTLPQNLLAKAQNYATQMILDAVQLTVKAVDLGFTSDEISRFRIGMKIDAESLPHGINTTLMLTSRSRNLNDPTNDEITLGKNDKSLTSDLVSRNEQIEDTTNRIEGNFIDRIIKQQTETLLGGGGYMINLFDENGHVTDTLYMDTNDVTTAQNVLRINRYGIGFSHDGVNGPYKNAWTIDGKFNADFINGGVISGVEFNNGDGGFKVDASGELTATKGTFDNLQTSTGYYVHYASGASGSAGWVIICDINITGTYVNSPIRMHIAQRGMKSVCELTIAFKGVNSTSPALDAFYYTGEEIEARIWKDAGTTTWRLAVKKKSNYDRIEIMDINIPTYIRNGIEITYRNILVADITHGTVAEMGALMGNLTGSNGTIGGFEISNAGLTSSSGLALHQDGSSTIYTVADLIIMRNYIMGVTGFDLSAQMIQHYDLTGDGTVGPGDYVALQNRIGIKM